MARILVVDDTPQNLKLIELYLRGTEFEMVSSASGHDAVEQCMKQVFDLILLDVVMPGIDGFEVCRRLKDDPRTAFVPVIFLTGRIGDESEKLAAYQLGAVDYIQKPVDRDELLARIRVMLRLEGARSRLDRENTALRDRLRRAEQQRDELRAAFQDLNALQRERLQEGSDDGSWGCNLLVLSSSFVVEACDPAVRGWIEGIEVGRELVHAGGVAARLQELVASVASADSAVPGCSLTLSEVPLAEGSCELGVRVQPLANGGRLVVLRDITSLRSVERRIADRAIYEPPAVPGEDSADSYRLSGFVGQARSVLTMTERVERLRQKRSTVLIYGESGTGKELVARALHFDGKHRNAPFIPLHCGAIAPELIESELFGHEKGAFTGAQQAHEGLFRAADGGTIFLDEIAETSPSLQVKLLRVLQRGEIRPVGASKPRIVDVRIIAATNRDLLELVHEGRFREDLYFRLQVVTLQLPPLRERMEDLPLLASHFLAAGNRRHERGAQPVRGFSRGAMERMMAYSWPGNVRELENAIEGAFAMDAGELLGESDLPDDVRLGRPCMMPRPVRRGAPAMPSSSSMGVASLGTATAAYVAEAATDAGSERQRDLRERRDAVERDIIQDALRLTGGDKAAAARRLGMARSTFYRRVKQMGL